MGAHPLLLERRDRLARGNYNRFVAHGRFSIERILSEAQYRVDSPPSSSGYLASQLPFGSNSADLCEWQVGVDDRVIAQETPNRGQLAQQWKLGLLSRGVTLDGMLTEVPVSAQPPGRLL